MLLIVSLLPINIYALETNSRDVDLTPDAFSSVVIEATTGQVLYNKNANKPHEVASLTKMMGLILIFEAMEKNALKTDEILTTSENAKNMGGSQIWLDTGEKISVDDLLKGIIMASANDAMVLMAERVSGTEEAFVSQMNKKAKELGLQNTYFKNSTGLDEDGAYSSAYDMAIIAKELIKHEKVFDYSKNYESYIRENIDNKTWITNTNKLVRFYDGTDGLKTGMTDKAGSCMTVTTKRNGLRLIAVTLGFPNSKIRNQETMDLLDYGFNQYETKIIKKKNDVVGQLTLEKATKDKIDLVLKDDAVIINKKQDKEKEYTYDVKTYDVSYPIKKDTVLGEFQIKENNKIVSKIDLVAKEDINKLNMFKLYLKVLKDILMGN